MKIVIIGGSGHVGTYLVPQLVKLGHEVTCISRQLRKPYQPSEEWKDVQQVYLDRVALEKQGNFGAHIAALSPDVVVDMICFTLESAQHILNSLEGKIGHFLHCGTIWVHGSSHYVPTTESQNCKPICSYGINKLAIEHYLLNQFSITGFPATVLRPGHITGPGWLPINPAGNLNPEVFRILNEGKELTLPNLGLETVHHVHASDVAAAFIQAINNRSQSIGEAFHVVSEQAITLRGYAEEVASWFNKEANLSFSSWESWKKTVSEEDARITWDHIIHSPNSSINKAKELINYKPKYTSLEAIKEALEWQISENNLLVSR